MTTQNNPHIAIRRLIVYLLAGAGIFALAMLGRTLLQPSDAGLDSAKLARSEPSLVRRSSGTADAALADIKEPGNLGDDDTGAGDSDGNIQDSDDIGGVGYAADKYSNRGDHGPGNLESRRRSYDAGSSAGGARVVGSGVADPGVDGLIDQDYRWGTPRARASGAENSGAGGGGVEGSSTGDSDTGDTGAGDSDSGDSDSGDSDSGDSDSGDSDSGDSETTRFKGRWKGRLNASTAVSENGAWNCAGARISVSMNYLQRFQAYRFSGTVRVDEGYLNHRKGQYFLVEGFVSIDGQLNGENKRVGNYWNVPDYKFHSTGTVSDDQASGTWNDNVGCNGTWHLTKR